MNFSEKLRAVQTAHQSLLCVGLDPDVAKFPAPLARSLSSVEEFNRAIIEATSDLACAYKLNWAFYEQYGVEGLRVLESTLRAIPSNVVTIADAKRGDIGNTSKAYAKAVFEAFGCDAVTVAPYMGRDSVEPFLEFTDKLTFVLALTSNQGSSDFQRLRLDTGKPLYQHVMELSLAWTSVGNVGFVVGATHPRELAEARKHAPESVFLIPGVGAQGGDAAETIRANGFAPALVNASRAVLYASSRADFAEQARTAAQTLRDAMNQALNPR